MNIGEQVVQSLLEGEFYKEFSSLKAAEDFLSEQGYTVVYDGAGKAGGRIYQKGDHRMYLSWPGLYQEPVWRVAD